MKVILIKDTDGKGQETLFQQEILNELNKEGLSNQWRVIRVADMGIYNKGVAIRVMPFEFLYTDFKQEDIPLLIQRSIKEEKPISEKLHTFKDKQVKIVLRNCGIIDPENIENYLQQGGYQGLKNVLFDYTPQEAIEELKTSGLKGRGGGGFPVWMKWSFTQKEESEEKYVICNGDEGDPGAYMDRSVLEGDPHSVLEGMLIAGYLIGAKKGYFYIRAEYPLAIKRTQKAIDAAQKCGLLGDNILGSDFSFSVEIRLGAGAFVCGEETALIASIEDRRGYPSPRPPYPSVKGLWGKPTVINNVETLANIPVIYTKGGKWFSSIGSPSYKGTIVFALTGKIKN